MKVLVVGLGYIGLPTAAVLASKNVDVVGVDIDKHVVDIVNRGEIHIVEEGLEDLVHESVSSGRLRATTKMEASDIFVISVPTPFKENNKPDLAYVRDACRSISPLLQKGNLIIIESTSPVGTTEKVVEWIGEVRSDLSLPVLGKSGEDVDVNIAYCPERVLPGRVIRELVENDRIIGGVTTQCSEKAAELYNVFVEAHCHLTSCRIAELSKLTENSFRDVNIAFANELSLICDNLDINVWQLIELSNLHPRVNILQPGPGVGGHCIAVDPWFIIDSSPSESKLIKTARMVNDGKPLFILEKIHNAVSSLIERDIGSLSIACLGLSFKPDIDDLRESPALYISREINSMGFSKQYLVEPNIDTTPSGFEESSIELVDVHFAINNSDVIVLLVDHMQFKDIDVKLLTGKKVIDTRGLFEINKI